MHFEIKTALPLHCTFLTPAELLTAVEVLRELPPREHYSRISSTSQDHYVHILLKRRRKEIYCSRPYELGTFAHSKPNISHTLHSTELFALSFASLARLILGSCLVSAIIRRTGESDLYGDMTRCSTAYGDPETIVREVSATSPKRGISSFFQLLWPRAKSAKIIPKLSGNGGEASSSSRSVLLEAKPKARLYQGRPSLRTKFSGLHSAMTQPSSMRLKRRGSASSSLYNLTFFIATRRASSLHTSQLYVNLKMHSANVFGSVTFLRAKPVILMTMRFLVSTAAQFVHTMHPKCKRQFIVMATRRDNGMHTILTTCGTLEIEEMSFSELSLNEENLCDTLASKYGASTHIQLGVGKELHFCFAIKGPMKPSGLLIFQTEFTAAMSFLNGQLADIDAALQNENRLHEAERSQKVRELDLQTNRFLRHEVPTLFSVIFCIVVYFGRIRFHPRSIKFDLRSPKVKNGIIGAIADLDALRDNVRDILTESRSTSDFFARSVPCPLSDRCSKSSLIGAMDNMCQDMKVPSSADSPTDSEMEDGAVETRYGHSSDHVKLCIRYTPYGSEGNEDPRQGQPNTAASSELSSSNRALGCDTESDTNRGERLMRCIRDIADDLARTMDLVTSSSIMRAVLQGSYTPRLDTFDASSICRSIHSDPNTITASPSSILVQTDSRLFRFILENAVSNARKYGLHCGPIAITMRTRQVVRDDDQTQGGTNLDKRSWLNVCVENKPGPGHERLLALDDCNRIFDQGTRFHDHDGAFKMRQLGSERNRISAGDGGWIMQQSARALGGYCSITFSPTHTNFSLDIPACIISEGEQRVFEPSSSEDSTAKACAVTADSTSLFLVALDDAPSQCRLLERYFKHIGLKDRSVIWQATSSIIDHFVPMAMDVVRREYAQNRKAKVVFFLDDRLSVRRPDGTHLSASGMALGIELRSALYEANLEGSTLLLVRSANDDPADIEIYCDRLHGLFPKLPMSKVQFNEVLRSHLDRRFGRDDTAPAKIGSPSDNKGDAGDITLSRT